MFFYYMKMGLFLGAGASVPYGMPDTREFKELLERFCQVIAIYAQNRYFFLVLFRKSC